MGKVFISYAHEDEEEAKAVEALLRELEADPFRDESKLRLGDRITPSVQEELDQCLALLVILSRHSLKSLWVPYEVGRAEALGKRVIPYLTNARLKVPHYMRDLIFAKSLEDIRSYFTRDFPMDGPEAKRLESEQLLFRDQFHNAESARKIDGIWHARWTRERENAPEEVFEEDTLEFWTNRSRIRALGRDSKPGTPDGEEFAFYPLEGVVSEDG